MNSCTYIGRIPSYRRKNPYKLSCVIFKDIEITLVLVNSLDRLILSEPLIPNATDVKKALWQSNSDVGIHMTTNNI